MAYYEVFSRQWDRLVQEFITDHDKKAPESFTMSGLQEWYRLNSYRWSSISEKEGVLLTNEENPALANALTQEISRFRFAPIPAGKKPTPWPGLAVAAVAAVILGVVLFRVVLKWRLLWIVLEALGCMVLALYLYANNLDRYNKTEKQRVCKVYAKQLGDYKEQLLQICRRYA